jgi:translation initiation factor IF-3
LVIASPRFDPRQARVQTGPRINERIRVPEVRVIADDGEMLGVLDTREALRIARERDFDLVEVNPKAFPPVCKIMNFGKFKYEEAKKTREAKKKQTVVKLKEIKLRPKTDDHDIDFKVKHIRQFISEGDKVKITVRFRGREITHPEMAQRQLDRILEMVKDVVIIESSSRMEGRTMIVMLAPRPVGGGGGGGGGGVQRIPPRFSGPQVSMLRGGPSVASMAALEKLDTTGDEPEDDDDDDDEMDDAEKAAAAEAEAAKKP